MLFADDSDEEVCDLHDDDISCLESAIDENVDSCYSGRRR